MALQRIYGHEFDRIIYDLETPAVIIFTRKTCHVCNEVKPVLEELDVRYPDVSFYYADVEEDAALFQRFSLKGVPQILFFAQGGVKGKLAGEIEDEQIEEKLELIIT
jgi:thioredoxin 1